MLADLFTFAGCGLALAAALTAYWRSRQKAPSYSTTSVGSGFIGSENVQQQGSHNTLHLHKTDYALLRENELLKEQVCHLQKQNRSLMKQQQAKDRLLESAHACFAQQVQENASLRRQLEQANRTLEQQQRRSFPFLPVSLKP